MFRLKCWLLEVGFEEVVLCILFVCYFWISCYKNSLESVSLKNNFFIRKKCIGNIEILKMVI